MSRAVRVFRPAVERQIEEAFGIVRPLTDAVRLLRAGQENSDRWLAARSATIGASEISILMLTEHPYHSRFSLWHVKAHGWGQHGMTGEQERGHLLEPGTARRFAAAHPELIVARPNGALWRDPQFPVLTCTPDFLTINADGVIAPLECKTDEGGDWGDESDSVPAHHRWQAWQQAGVFAAPYTYVARWSGHHYRDYVVPYDHERYCRGAEVAAEFLATVAAGTPPPVDAHRASGAVLRDEHPWPAAPVLPAQIPAEWRAERDALTEAKAQIERQIREIDNRTRQALGDAAYGWDSEGRSYTRTKKPRKGYTVPPGEIDQVRVSEPPAPKEAP